MQKPTHKNILILGAGGHARVLIDTLRHHDVNILGILDPNPACLGQEIQGVRVIGNDDDIRHYSPDAVWLVNGVGSVDLPSVRKNIFLRFKSRGFEFYTMVHPNAYVSATAILEEGCQVMAGSVVQPGTRIGINAIINTNVSVDHDVWVGDHSHLAPGTVVSGGARIEEECHIGARAVVLQLVVIGQRSLVGAGAVVIRSIRAGSRVVGVPAKEIATIREEYADEELE